MTAYRQKIISDIRRERARSVLVVLAIAIGIAAFLTVLSSYAVLTRELNRGYLATNPASLILRADRLDDAQIAAVQASPNVAAAEPRRSISARIKVGPAEWRNLILFIVKNYGDIRVNSLAPQEGSWPPIDGEILIERDALQVARARIGDDVTVKATSGVEHALRVSGTAHDVGQAQARMENLVYGYITLETLAALGEEPYLDRLNVVVNGNRFDEQRIRAVGEELKRLIEGHGGQVNRVEFPKPGKHPHSDIMGLLMLTMAGFGLFAMLLSGVIVFNLLTALMAGQTRQIGMMKAIGGTRWPIARIYLTQALILGGAALVIALPIGIWGSRLLCRYLSVFLNFDIASYAGPAWVYLLVGVVGVLIPLAAAAYPVWRSSGVPVRAALTDYGVARSAFGTSGFDRALAGLGGFSRPMLLAIRNSFRKRTRLALTLLTLSASGLSFMSALNVRSSMINTLDRLFATRRFDLSINLGVMSPMEKVERAVRQTPHALRAEGWIVAQGAIPNPGEAAAPGSTEPHGSDREERFNVIATPPDTTLLQPDLIQGRYLAPGESEAIVVNSALASKLPNLKIGEDMVFRIGPEPSRWKIVGVARESFTSAAAYIPLKSLQQRGGDIGMVNSLRLALEKKDPATINQVKLALEQSLQREGLRAVGVSGKADNRYAFDQHMVMIYVFLIIVSCILAAVGGLGLMTTMSISVLERRREMGVLRAIGATPRTVWAIVIAEGTVIGLLSWAAASLLAWPVSKALGDLFLLMMFKSRLIFQFELKGLLIWLTVSLALCAIASFLPAWRASTQSVVEAIGYE